MFDLDLASEPQLHNKVASLLADAHKEISAVYEKHRAKHKQYRAECEKRVLAGDVEALKEYRQLIRIEQSWKHFKSRLLGDVNSLSGIARAR